MKIGDKVKIKKDLKQGQVLNDVDVVSFMLPMRGKIVTISFVNTNGLQFKIKEDDENWWYSIDMIDHSNTSMERKRKIA